MRVNLNEEFSISKIVIGCMRMNQWELSIDETVEFIEWCIENGITTFDHANIYGGNHINEYLFGEALKVKPELREKIEIITKCNICVANDENPNINTRYFDTSREYIVD